MSFFGDRLVHFNTQLNESTKEAVLSYIASYPFDYWKKHINIRVQKQDGFIVIADGLHEHLVYDMEIH